MSNSSVWPIDRASSNATTPGQSDPESNCHEEVLHIFQISWTRALPSDRLISYAGHSWVRVSYPFAEMQMVYSTAPVNWAIFCWLFRTHNSLKLTSAKKREKERERLQITCCSTPPHNQQVKAYNCPFLYTYVVPLISFLTFFCTGI